jgi:hypothetical protein
MNSPHSVELLEFINKLPMPMEQKQEFARRYIENIKSDRDMALKHRTFYTNEVMDELQNCYLQQTNYSKQN